MPLFGSPPGFRLVVDVCRLFPQAGTPTHTPSPKKGVGFTFDNGSPSTDNDSTAEYSPQPIVHGPHTPSPTDLPPRMGIVQNVSPLGSDSEETSMDIADDNLTLPLPSALIKAQLQRGVGFLVDDEGGESEEEMDMMQPFVVGGGGIIPSRDGVNRFLNGDDDQTMEFTQICPSQNNREAEDDTMGMEFTRVVGKIQGLHIPVAVDKENRPPVDDEDGTPSPSSSLIQSQWT